MDLGVISTVEKVAGLTALKAAVFDTSKLCLIKTDIPIGPDSVLADLEAEKCDFSGYGDITVALYHAAFRESNGDCFLGAPTQFFTQNGGAVENQCYGWYVKDNAGAVLLGGGKFSAPRPATIDNPVVLVDPFFKIPA